MSAKIYQIYPKKFINLDKIVSVDGPHDNLFTITFDNGETLEKTSYEYEGYPEYDALMEAWGTVVNA